jgi:hypothetical protein
MKEIAMKLLVDPVFWVVLVTLLLAALGWLVKRTKSTKDDEMYEKIVNGYIHNAFNLAEKFIPDGSTGTLGKVDVALKQFNADYEKYFGTGASTDLLEIAKAKWAVLAAQIKVAKAKAA